MVVNQIFLFVGMTGFEPATTRPPDAYSNRAELHPALFCVAKVRIFCKQTKYVAKIFVFFFSSTPCLMCFWLILMAGWSKK